jgi:uncharacterized protein YbjT (DUF2867 family)
MSSKQAALVLGASGSVGQALVAELIGSGLFSAIVTLVRRSQPIQHTQARDAGVALQEMLITPMDFSTVRAATEAAAKSLEGDIVGFSVLGIGAGTAKISIDAHRAVDVQLNAAFAAGLSASRRVRHLALMSAVGANPNAASNGSGAPGLARYARVKGEAEEAVKQAGLAVVSIFRPATIIGSKHTPWLLEKLLPAVSSLVPAKYKSITAAQIAKAMVAVAENRPTTANVYHYPEMMALNTVLSASRRPA